MGFIPFSISLSAANNPAGPAPIIITSLELLTFLYLFTLISLVNF